MADVLERLKSALADRYQIERELGSGGMATVYLAEDLKHHRRVAIKVLRPELAASLGADRFLREIEITANLNHPHILPLLDSGEADSFLYYVMPYVEGESLRDRLIREKQLPIPDALKIASEVADALGFAHEHNVVHRDIKPENILLEARHAVVADFGIARAVSEAGGDRLTDTGMSVGTPSYMSPEQAGGEREIDGRSDIYALGCVLYEMLAGEPPFTGPTVEAIVHKHLTAEPQPVTDGRPKVPADVATILQRVLSKAPADRYQRCDEFAAELAAAQVSISPLRSVARGRRMLSLIGGLGAVAVLLVGLALVLTRRPEAAARPIVAVLPFVNVGGDPDAEYFSDGITGDIINHLAKIASLDVISRTSVMQYKRTDKNLRQIGEELGVSAIVEGEVQRSGDRVRINAQLIDADEDTHLWAEQYQRRLVDVFTLQSEISQEIATALGALLTPDEVARVQAAPTDSEDAYDLYLRANDLRDRARDAPRAERVAMMSRAIGMYQRVIEMDPEFAPAYAKIARTHLYLYWRYLDRSASRLELGKVAAERALLLGPNLADVQLAQGYYHYWGRRDYEAALEALVEARRLAPGDVEVYRAMAHVQRRMGRFEEALQEYERVYELDPRGRAAHDLAATYAGLRRYDDAIRLFAVARQVTPDYNESFSWAAMVFRKLGNLDSARAVLTEYPDSTEWSIIHRAFRIEAYARDFDAAGSWLAKAGQRILEQEPWVHLDRAFLLDWTARHEESRDFYRQTINTVERSGASTSTHAIARAIAHAALGERELAMIWLDSTETLRTSAQDAWLGFPFNTVVLVHERLGDHEGAIDVLEELMTMQSGTSLSVADLRLDPKYDSLRSHPRFQALLAKYGN